MDSKADQAPLYEMLEKHAGLRTASFHVPGHKQRADWRHEQANNRYRHLLPLDVTELPDTDDLHHAYGGIAEAQRLAADCFGADETRFLVGGSTAGNMAMIIGTSSPGDLFIVQRNVHRSIIHAFMLAGVRAVFLQPEQEPQTGLPVLPLNELIQQAVARYPEAKGVILSSPNYYGMSGDLKAVVRTCHSAGVPVLVDEAHGPHFGLHPAFPSSALQAGADIVVQSAHKMLSAMTMGAMLHFKGSLIYREPVRQALRMVQSSSPSFPILASLDLARREVHMQGSAAFEQALNAVRIVREGLPATTFRDIGEIIGENTSILQDPLKLVLYEHAGRWEGFRLRDELAERGCAAEMADDRFVVIAFGIGSRDEDGERLLRVLSEMSARMESNGEKRAMIPLRADSSTVYSLPEPVELGRTLSNTVAIRLENSLDRIAGEWIVPYPPGIPVLFPGERITEASVETLKNWRKQGAYIQGAEDPSLVYIRVREC